jgi:hypothetical protein
MRDIEPRARNHLDIDAGRTTHIGRQAAATTAQAGAEPEYGPRCVHWRQSLRLPRRSDLIAQPMNRDPEHEHQPPEPWVTKRQLCRPPERDATLDRAPTATRPPAYIHSGMNRYRISEVKAWLRERSGSPSEASQPRNR